MLDAVEDQIGIYLQNQYVVKTVLLAKRSNTGQTYRSFRQGAALAGGHERLMEQDLSFEATPEKKEAFCV